MTTDNTAVQPSVTCDRFFIGLASFTPPTGAGDLLRALTTIALEHRTIADLVTSLPDILSINVAKELMEPERFDFLPRMLNTLPEDIDRLKAELELVESETHDYVKNLLYCARYLNGQAKLIENKLSNGELTLLSLIDSPKNIEEVSEKIRSLIQKIKMLPKNIELAEQGVTKFTNQIEALPDNLVAASTPITGHPGRW
ncbi:MAG: hypothetical protein ACRDPW_08900 [Mycobacteriales bacterium]